MDDIDEDNGANLSKHLRREDRIKMADISTTMGNLITDNSETVAPLVAITGIGIPLALILITVGKLMKMNIIKKILVELLNNCKIILKNAVKNHKLIIRKLQIYNEQAKNIGKEKDLNKFGLNEVIINKLVSQLTKVNILLNTLLIDDSKNEKESRLQRFGKYMSNMTKRIKGFTKGNYYISEITRELTVLNSFFMLYSMQVQELEDYHYNTFFTPSEIEEIKKTIINSDEYNDYLKKSNFEDKVKEVKDEIERSGLTDKINNLDNEIQKEAVKHLDQKVNESLKNNGQNKEGNNIKGGKIIKRKRINKKSKRMNKKSKRMNIKTRKSKK